MKKTALKIMQASSYPALQKFVNNFVKNKDVVSTSFTTERSKTTIYYTAFIYYKRRDNKS